MTAIADAYDPRFGMRAFNPATGQSLHLAVDTPFLSWQTRWATVLPGDQVVLQIGPQITLVDLNTRELAFVAFGYSPVIVLDQAASTPTVSSPAQLPDGGRPIR
ncbi:MAG TPA: hypothetical protein VGI81_03140 [Tepidisphaeraceae bacterium]